MHTTLVVAQHQHANFKIASNPPKFYYLRTEDNLQYFIAEILKDLKAVSTHSSEAVEFAAYQLNDVAHAWFDMQGNECSTTSPAPTWAEFEEAIMQRLYLASYFADRFLQLTVLNHD
ncbi:hypothetical protein HAX54_043209 [Datura stramonium]|uniref:Retrotransposon gag domain-containing protein n=1 Tax=Datura stramonium TaxID=4076 RepID=A0ABS8W3G5_DATST|nr:hypothetical protein [Datura stramonium]